MTTHDMQQMLLLEVGAGLDGLPDVVVSAVLDMVTPFIDIYWEAWRAKQVVYPGLHYLYVKRQCLDILMGRLRDRIAISIQGASVPQNQIFENLNKIRANTVTEITRIEGIALASRAPALGVMSSTIHMDAYGRVFNPYAPVLPPGTRIY